MKHILVILFCLFSSYSYAQTGSKMKFGKVSKEEFTVNQFQNDTSVHAIVLTELGSSEFDSEGDWFKLKFKVHRRIKIVDKNGLDEANNVVTLYRGGTTDEELSNLKATTYNLENGEIVETKMDNKSVFTEKVDKDYINKRFTLPAVKEGSIIEYSYTISSPYFHLLRSWYFQGSLPCLYSEYKVAIPEYFDYIQLRQGFEKFDVETKEVGRQTFSFHSTSSSAVMSNQSFTLTPTIGKYTWALKDIPALKRESFITTSRNYANKMEFQLSAMNLPGRDKKPMQSSWPLLMKNMLEDKDMGAALKEDNAFLRSKVKELTENVNSELQRAKNIFKFVRDNYTVDGDESTWLTHSLKTTFTSKKGNVTDINILLTAMLLQAGFDAYPIVLSTRDHGYLFQTYPIYSRLNYTIAGLHLGEQVYTLDASEGFMGFGKLPARCYNGGARNVTEIGDIIWLNADSLFEQKITSITIEGIENGKLKGTMFTMPSYFESIDIRREVEKTGESKYADELNKQYKGITVSDLKIDNLDSLEVPLMLQFRFTADADNADLVYFNPVLIDAYKKNPFVAAERKFPVEMPYVSDEMLTLNFVLPDDYVVDELPQSAKAKLNDNDGYFEYLLNQVDNRIQFRFRLQLKKALFSPEEYAVLRSFYDLVVKKQAEQIVLKKKK